MSWQRSASAWIENRAPGLGGMRQECSEWFILVQKTGNSINDAPSRTDSPRSTKAPEGKHFGCVFEMRKPGKACTKLRRCQGCFVSWRISLEWDDSYFARLLDIES